MKRVEGHRTYERDRGKQIILGAREKRRLFQLGACLLIFFIVFAAKGADRLASFRSELEGLLKTDANFSMAVDRLGWALQTERPLGETLVNLFSEVLLPKEGAPLVSRRDGPTFLAASQDLNGDSGYSTLLLGEKQQTEQMPRPSEAAPEPETSTPTPEPQQPEEEPEVVVMPYDGPELPEEASMDKYNLHLEEIVSPVVAAMTSNFGWRQDPFGEDQSFHHGLDMGVPTGTSVLAFGAGEVEYIGESDIYGQYLQIDHGNGVKSFYAHCSKLCVRQGQEVEAGEKVAESGETGNATGPHLHLELKKDGIFLNPAYYVTLLPS